MSTFEVGKTYKTRQGYDAKILSIEGTGDQPICAIHYHKCGDKSFYTHSLDGRYHYAKDERESEFDLMLPKRERFIVYRSDICNVNSFALKASALSYAGMYKGKVIRFVEDCEVTE